MPIVLFPTSMTHLSSWVDFFLQNFNLEFFYVYRAELNWMRTKRLRCIQLVVSLASVKVNIRAVYGKQAVGFDNSDEDSE